MSNLQEGTGAVSLPGTRTWLRRTRLLSASPVATLRHPRCGKFDERTVMEAMPEPDSKPPIPARVPEEKRATEYLANERTFLAWIRTSIAVISFGFLITRVPEWLHPVTAPAASPSTGRVNTSFVMGLAMMAFGAIGAILAAWRYHIVNRDIHEGRVKPDRGLIILVTVLVVVLTTGMITFMLLKE